MDCSVLCTWYRLNHARPEAVSVSEGDKRESERQTFKKDQKKKIRAAQYHSTVESQLGKSSGTVQSKYSSTFFLMSSTRLFFFHLSEALFL